MPQTYLGSNLLHDLVELNDPFKLGDQGLVFLIVFVYIQKLTVIQNKVFRDYKQNMYEKEHSEVPCDT